MRLVCPNCGAQYEVDDRVIPDSGRDVQCSNCGHAWFQRGANWQHEHEHEQARHEHEESEVPASEGGAAEEPGHEPGTTTQHGAEPEPEPEPQEFEPPQPDLHDSEEPESGTPEQEGAPEPPSAPRRQEMDDGVRSILREEAEREMGAREREAASMETQEELGLDAPPDDGAGQGMRARMARLRGLDVEDEETDSPAHRRDLLPDIEEINSSLTSIGAGDERDDFAEDETGRRAGFSRGFGIVLLLAVLAVLLYMYAPLIGKLVPALAPAMDAYTEFLDALRNRIDGLMQLAIDKIQGGGRG